MEAIRPANALVERRKGSPARTAPGYGCLCCNLRTRRSSIKAPQLVKAFARAAANSGATFYSSREILGVARQDRRVTGVYTAQDELIACNQLVVASGAWAAGCGIWLDIPLPGNPPRCPILTF